MPESDMSNRLNILHIASWYPSRRSPQNGNFIQRHIEAIGQLANSFTLHVVSDPALRSWSDVELEKVDNQSVVVVYPKGGILSKFTRNKSAHRIGYQEIRAICSKFDLIHVHVMFPCMAYAKELADSIGVPLVVTEHATAYHDDHPASYNWWQRFFLRRYSRTVQKYFPVSADLQNSMEAMGIHGEYEVIPNVVDTNLFKPADSKLESDTFEFIHISSLKDEHKNVSGLLSIFAEIVEKHPEARLTIIGNEHHTQVQRYIQLLKLGGEVGLLREVPIEKVATHLQKSHALLLFSNYENAPCVISEAHCVGLPVIATNVGGVSEMIDAGNGLLVGAGDIYGMYAAMSKMIKSYHTYDRVQINKVASMKYGYEVVAAQYLASYKQVLLRN